MSGHIIVVITASGEEEAGMLSRTLIDERLIACANRFPVSSIYRWQGRIEEEGEVMLLCKTNEEKLDPLISRVKELHSYEVPEIIALPIMGGSRDYLAWITDSTED